MIDKPTAIRFQFLLTINFVLVVILLLFGAIFWLEWGYASKKHTDEIRLNSIEDSKHNLLHGFQIYEGEIQYQFRQLENAAEGFDRSEEFRSLVAKNRVDPLKHLISHQNKDGLFDFAAVLNEEGDLVATFPDTANEMNLDNYYKQPGNAINDVYKKLSGKPLGRNERVTSSYFLIPKNLAKDLGIKLQSSESDFEFGLITVVALYSDFGDPVGILALGKMFSSLKDVFTNIKNNTQIDYSVYALDNSSVTTGLHDHSPLADHHQNENTATGPFDGTFYISHHGGNLLCRNIVIQNELVGAGCTGMPVALANRSVNRIEAILTDLRNTISFWYIILGFLAVITSTILAFVLSRRLTRPLELVTRAIEKLARKDLDIKLPDNPGSTEIATISDATEIFKHNIQKMREVEKKLREQREAALLSNRIKSQFLGNMGHDLRTPLNAIIGFSEVLSGEFFGKLGHAKYQEYSRDIHFSGRHLLDLINNILDVSSIESGKFKMEEKWFDLPEVGHNSVRLHQFLADQSNVKLETGLCDSVVEFFGDALRFQQILNNLISNAIKFTPPMGQIDVLCEIVENEYLVIMVKDTGAGIPVENLDQIFDPFFLGDDKTVTPQRGTGLGLFLVKSFVDFHDGTVSVDSELGKGTCFTLKFPKNRFRTPNPDTDTDSSNDCQVSSDV